MGALVTMRADGRVTVPAAVRRALGIVGETPFRLEIRDGTLILWPAEPPPLEDAWAYTLEHLALVQHALRDSSEGRVRRLSEQELDQLASPSPASR